MTKRESEIEEESQCFWKTNQEASIEESFRSGAEWADQNPVQGEVINDLLKEAHEILEKVCAKESDGFEGEISDEFTSKEILEGRAFLERLGGVTAMDGARGCPCHEAEEY